MKKILVIILTGFLIFAIPAFSDAQQRNKIHYVKKKKHTRLYKLLHGRRDRLQIWNTGHTEFKNRTKKDQRRLSKNHLKPTPDTKNAHSPTKSRAAVKDKDE